MITAISVSADLGLITRWSRRATNPRPGAYNGVVVGSFLLAVPEAERRMLVLNRRETYDAFLNKTAGLPLEGVEVRLIETR